MRTAEATLTRPRLSEDLIPFTEYRRTLRDCHEKTRRTHRPLFITQNGRATTIVMSIGEYEQMQDELLNCREWFERAELTHDVEVSRREFAEGKGIPARQVFDELRSELLAKKKVHA